MSDALRFKMHLLVKDKIQVEGTLARPLPVLFLPLRNSSEGEEQNPQNNQDGKDFLQSVRHP